MTQSWKYGIPNEIFNLEVGLRHLLNNSSEFNFQFGITNILYMK